MEGNSEFDDFFSDLGAPADYGADPSCAGIKRVPPRLGMLEGLSEEAFDRVARAAKLTHWDTEVEIFRQGDPADRFFIVVDGEVEIERDNERIAMLSAGSFFGESALLVGGYRSATVRTICKTSLWSIGFDAFDGAVSQHFLADDERAAETARRIAQTPHRAFEGVPRHKEVDL